MMLLMVLLNIGAVYALIPIIIIIILIIAARGSATGADFFALFGIGTLYNLAGGIGGGGSGRGIGRTQYRSNQAGAKALGEAQRAQYDILQNPLKGPGEGAVQGKLFYAIRNDNDEKKRALKNPDISRQDVIDMIKHYKVVGPNVNLDGMDKNQLIKKYVTFDLDLYQQNLLFAPNIIHPKRGEERRFPAALREAKKLLNASEFAGWFGYSKQNMVTLAQVNDYVRNTLKKPTGDLQPPGSGAGHVKLSVKGTLTKEIWPRYKLYLKAKLPGTKARFDTDPYNRAAMEKYKKRALEAMTPEEIRQMLEYYKIKNAPATDDQLGGFAEQSLDTSKIRAYYTAIRKRK